MSETSHRPEGENLDPAANLLGENKPMTPTGEGQSRTTTPLMDQVLGGGNKASEWTPERVDQLREDLDEVSKPLGWESLKMSPEERAEGMKKVEDLLEVMPGQSKTEKIQNLWGMTQHLAEIDRKMEQDAGASTEDASSQEQAA